MPRNVNGLVPQGRTDTLSRGSNITAPQGVNGAISRGSNITASRGAKDGVSPSLVPDLGNAALAGGATRGSNATSSGSNAGEGRSSPAPTELNEGALRRADSGDASRKAPLPDGWESNSKSGYPDAAADWWGDKSPNSDAASGSYADGSYSSGSSDSYTYNDYSTNYFISDSSWSSCPNNWSGNWGCWNPCVNPCWSGWRGCGWGGWGAPGWGWGGWGWGGGWSVGFGFGGSGWSVGIGFSSGWGGWGWGGGGWGWGGCGAWNGWWAPSPFISVGWWPSTCSTWFAPWYVGAVFVPSPVVVSAPVFAPVIASPLVIEAPVVYTPALDWPGYAPIDSQATAVTQSAAPSTVPAPTDSMVVVMPPAGLLEQQAWDELSVGLEWQAEETFARVLGGDPDNPRARAGYGLAAALSRRDATAAWALRDALSLRPDVLDALPLMPVLRTRLTDLARGFEARGMDPSGRGTMEDLFLAAALRAAVGDRAQAAYAMDLASRRGALDAAQSEFRSRLASQLASGM